MVLMNTNEYKILNNQGFKFPKNIKYTYFLYVEIK